MLIAGCSARKNAEAPVAPADPQPQAARPPGAPTGTLEGTVRLEGVAPAPVAVSLPASVSRQCGASLTDAALRVGEGGGLAGVVVSVEAPAGQAAPGRVFLDQRGCAYVPAVLAARAGAVLEVRNSDPLIHNVRAQAGATTLFNVGMPLEGMVTRRPLASTPGVIELKCDVHPWMRAWVKTFAHEVFTVTDERGRYRLAGVPSGAQQVVFWHPRLEERRLPARVPVGGEAQVDASLAVR